MSASARLLIVLSVIGCAPVSGARSAEPPQAGDPCAAGPGNAAGPVSFRRDIQPIFDDNCVACHQAGAPTQGLVLEDGRSRGATVGKPSRESKLSLIEAGDPSHSYLFRKISGTHKEAGGNGQRMPLGGTLEAGSVDAICRWIAGGARDD